MTETRFCSFCRTPKDQCAVLIAGPEAAICNECIVTCVRSIICPPATKPDIVTAPLIVKP